MGGVGSIQLATATAQRKKRTSRTKGKVPRQESLTKPTTTVTDIDIGTTTKVGGIESETKVPIEEEDEEEEEMMKLRLAQGRQLSLPLEGSTARGRKRLFSMAAKRIGGYEGVLDSAEKEAEEREKEKRRKHRLIHRARTVGSSPSQKPTINPEKYRRCQTPEFSVEGDKAEVRKGLALRKCKTPEVIMMRRETKREGEGEKRQQSDSPNTSSSPSPAKSGGAPEGETDGKAKVGGGGEGGGTEGTETAATAATQGDSLATKLISTDATASTKRKWGSRREKSRKDPGSPLEAPKKAKVPPHISASASSYLVSGSVATAPRGGESASAGLENPPYIYFSLYFDIQRRALTVNLIKVENLPPKPPNQGSCDPFVMMFLLPNKQEVLQSVIKQGTLNPEFQQVFEFGGILANDLKNQVLVFRVFDHDRFSKNDLMGTVIMPLKDADLYGMLMRRPVDQRKGLLKQFSAGDLLFSLTYSEERRVINGIILKATNLRKADIWGLADPYVKIYMIHESKRMNKWKTEVKKNTLVPIYNESFQFDVSGLNIRNVSLEVWVMDYDWFSRNDKMGVVYVGANSPQEVGRNHWMEIISVPKHQTSHWHTIIPYTDLKQVLPLAKQQLQQRQLQVQQQEELQQQQQQ
jgi:synaptotagmin-1